MKLIDSYIFSSVRSQIKLLSTFFRDLLFLQSMNMKALAGLNRRASYALHEQLFYRHAAC